MRKTSSNSPSANRTGLNRRRPLADITSTSLNRVSANPVTDRQSSTTICEPANARNQLTNVSENGLVHIAFPGDVCVPAETLEPVLRLCASNAFHPIPIWDVRCSALWCMDLSSFNIFTKSTEVLSPNTRYQNVVHPCLANNLAWLTSQNEDLYEHFSSLEQEPRYQWDLSYVARLKKIAKADRAGIVDTMVYFGMRVRLHHPTVHLAVNILDRYLTALLCPPRVVGSDSQGANELTEAEEVEKVKDSEQVIHLLGLPCAMKALACTCIWLAVTMEELQKQFNPQWFYDVLFTHTAHSPTVSQLSQLMINISETLDYDLLAPTVHTFLVRLVPLAKFSGEDVQVVRCLSERALLEPLYGTKHHSYHTNNTSPPNTILGVYLPSCIAASCVFLARAHMLALRHQLPLLHYLQENNPVTSDVCAKNENVSHVVTAEENTTEKEEVWTASLARFSGYSAEQLLPCVKCLHNMLQLETYHRARLYAHTLCPSGRYSDLQDTVQAMTSTCTTTVHGNTSDSSNSGVVVDGEGVKKDPLKEYLKLLPHILMHMQGTIASSFPAVVRTIPTESTPSATTTYATSTARFAPALSTPLDSGASSVASSATTVNTSSQYVPLFRTFGKNLSTDASATATATTNRFYHNENHSQQGSQYSQLSQLTDVEASQATLPAQVLNHTHDSAASKALSRQLSNRTVDTINTTCTTETSNVRSSKRLRTSSMRQPVASATTGTSTTTSYTTLSNGSTIINTLSANSNPTNPISSHKDAFFDPARLLYSQDGYSNPFPQYVHNTATTCSSAGSNKIASFLSILGKRRNDDSAVISSTVMDAVVTGTVSSPSVPESTRVLALSAALQDTYRLYPVPYPTNTTNTNANTTNKNDTVPSLLDYSIAHTEGVPAIRESVRLKYYSVYGRLVTCPPI